MRSVSHELTEACLGCLSLGEGELNLSEHRVERVPQPADLRSIAADLNALRQVPRGDGAGGLAHSIERSKAPADQEQRCGCDGREHAGGHGELDGDEAAQRLVCVAHRDGNDHGQAVADLLAQRSEVLRRVVVHARRKRRGTAVGPHGNGGGDHRVTRRGVILIPAEADGGELLTRRVAELGVGAKGHGDAATVSSRKPTKGARPSGDARLSGLCEQSAFDVGPNGEQLLIDALEQEAAQKPVGRSAGDGETDREQGQCGGHQADSQRHGCEDLGRGEAQAVAGAANRVDERRLEAVDLLAQIRDVGLHHVGVTLEVVLPHVVEYLRL